MKPVLVDTSVWIEFFRHGTHAADITALIHEGRLVTCGLVQAELFPHARQKRRAVEAYFQKMSYLTFADSDWKDCIEIQNQLVPRGERAGIPDLILLCLCRKYETALWSLDNDFARLARMVDFSLWRPDPDAGKP